MKQINDLFNKYKSKLGSNKNKQAKNGKWIIVGFIGICILIGGKFVMNFVYPTKPVNTKKKIEVAGVIDDDFNAADEKSALTANQDAVAQLRKEFEAEQLARKQLAQETKVELEKKDKRFVQYQKEQEAKEQQYQDRIAQIQTQTNNSGSKAKDSAKNTNDRITENGTSPIVEPITFDAYSMNYDKYKEKEFKKTWQNYLPSATYCRAVTLSGADAKAGVMSNSNTTPVMFKLQDCWLPDNHHISTLRNSHVLASVYGDIGTERGVVRLESISFFDKKTGESYDIPVEGTVSDISGRNGIKGVPVLRNKAVLMSAGLAGGISGLGGAVSQLGTTQAIGAGGVVNTFNPDRIGYSVAGGAASKGADNIANYYIKLAESYSPIIEIRPGSVVNIIFQHGFPYKDKDAIEAYSKNMNQVRVEQSQADNVSQQKQLAPNIGAVLAAKTEKNAKENTPLNGGVANQTNSSNAFS